MKVKFKKLHPDAKLPTYAKPGDAGMDLYVCFEASCPYLYLGPGQRMLVPTGLAMELPERYEAQIRPRSGLALKHGISIINSPGTVDSAYRGALGIILINHDVSMPFKIENGMKIAQMVIKPIEKADIYEVDELSETERGSGGFGSTGE